MSNFSEKGCPACGEVRRLYTVHECKVDMNKEFEVHMLNEDGKKKAQVIAEGFDKLLEILRCFCPEGREFAVAKTKLEEACFFAKKSMANHPGGLNAAPGN